MDTMDALDAEQAPLLMTTETRPLLSVTAANTNRTPWQRSADFTTALRKHLSQWSSLYLCLFFVLLIDIPSFMSEPPKLRMLELALCRQYYSAHDPGMIGDDGSVSERLCKLPEIQSSLAKYLGLLGMLGGLPGLVLAVPYGILADLRGRRLVAGICLVGFILRDLCYFAVLYFYKTFPLRGVFAAPLFTLFGGGSTVISPMILAIVAMSVSEESRIQAFFLVHVTTLVTELLSPVLGAVMMNNFGSHFAFLAAVPLEIAAFFALGLVREPTPGNERENMTGPDECESDDGDAALKLKLNFGRPLAKFIYYIRKDIGALLVQKNLLIGLFAVVGCRLGRPMLELTLQYMSARFNWSLSKTSYLISIQAAAQIFIFLLILPALSAWLLQRFRQAPVANLALARGSVIVLSLATLGLALAPVAPLFIAFLILYNFGNGFASAMRSFLTSLVPQNRIATLFTTIALFEGVSSFIFPPLIGFAFSFGLRKGGLAVSLPFFIVAAIYGLGAVAVSSIRYKHRDESEEERGL